MQTDINRGQYGDRASLRESSNVKKAKPKEREMDVQERHTAGSWRETWLHLFPGFSLHGPAVPGSFCVPWGTTTSLIRSPFCIWFELSHVQSVEHSHGQKNNLLQLKNITEGLGTFPIKYSTMATNTRTDWQKPRFQQLFGRLPRYWWNRKKELRFEKTTPSIFSLGIF